MTVYSDLQRAIAMAEALRGSYLLFATDTEEEKAQKVFTDMAEDMKRHVLILESRKEYLQQNPLNAAKGQGGGEQQGGEPPERRQNGQKQQNRENGSAQNQGQQN